MLAYASFTFFFLLEFPVTMDGEYILVLSNEFCRKILENSQAVKAMKKSIGTAFRLTEFKDSSRDTGFASAAINNKNISCLVSTGSLLKAL
ncbi:hypothetical protein CEXT_472111 [Caerostris extrusa]|uniref:Uncharacterized protein n=1 Tax=Caerostris extrusa TaxID=172846 RepID=A0AAV4XTL1_CAEEX|nr:hypothetical protein CEXT_472111 [Caerostris extrusa]